MQSSSIVKVVSAFVVGVVVALGSALIYAKVSDLVHPQPAIHAAAPAESTARQQVPTRQIKAPQEVETPEPSAALEQPEPQPRTSPKARKLYSEPRPTPRASSTYHLPARTSHSTPHVDVAQTYTPPVLPAQPIPGVVEPGKSMADRQRVEQDSTAQLLPQDRPEPQLQASAAPPSPDIPRPQPHVVTLEAGTRISIRLQETISTEQNYSGDTFRATLDAPIIQDGFVIADKNSKVLGQIVNLDKPGRFNGAADIVLALTEINTTDGQRVHIQTGTFAKRGQSTTSQNAAKMGGAAALGAIIGAIAGGGKGAAIGAGAGGALGTGAVLLSHAGAVVVPTETQMDFRLSQPVTLTEKLNP